MPSMEARVVALVNDFTPALEEFESVALGHLTRFVGCDGAWFATIGPRFVARSPPYFQRMLADPRLLSARKARQIAARFGTTFTDAAAYSPVERDRRLVFREVLRPAGISSVALSAVNVAGNTTGIIHLVRDRHPFDPDALAAARPLLRTISIMHRALVGASEARQSAEPLAGLSQHEREVALLAGEGYGALQIAARLGKSTHTVRRQLESVYRKCAIGNRAELAALIQRARPSPVGASTRSHTGASLLRILDALRLRPAVPAEDWHAV